MGLQLYEIFSEHGAGQFEANLEPCSGLLAIDRMIALKIAIKEVARSLGLRATFMSRPTGLEATPPSGYHLHQSLLDAAGANLLADPADPDGLSALARHYVAGQLAHAPAMTGVASPDRYRLQALPEGHLGADPGRLGHPEPHRPGPRAARRGRRPGSRTGWAAPTPTPTCWPRSWSRPAWTASGGELPAPEPAADNLFDNIRYDRLPTSPPEGLDALLADTELTAALGPVFTTTFADVLRLDWHRYLSHVSDWEISEYREML